MFFLDDAQSNVFDSQEDQAGLNPYNCHFEVALVEQAVLEMGDRVAILGEVRIVLEESDGQRTVSS